MRRSGARTKDAGHTKGGVAPRLEWALQDLNLRPTDYESAHIGNASLRVPTGTHVNAPVPTREVP